MSMEKTNEVLDNTMVIVPIMGSYFDMSEFKVKPIKNLIRTFIYNLDSRMVNGQNYYVKRQHAVTKDHWLGKFLGGEEFTYFDVDQ